MAGSLSRSSSALMLHGLVLGKFMPPHKGHSYLIDFARHFTPDLTVVVGSLESEPIAGELRVAWMRELFPTLSVLHLTDENPQYPEEHPDFWDIWRDSLKSLVERKIDVVFAGEGYGEMLAQVLGARFIPTQQGRSAVEVSGTQIRAEPLKYWDFLSPVVQSFFVKRVLVEGGTPQERAQLCGALAQEFGGAAVPEYGSSELPERELAVAQWATEQAVARLGHKILFCHSNLTDRRKYHLVLSVDDSQTQTRRNVHEMLKN